VAGVARVPVIVFRVAVQEGVARPTDALYHDGALVQSRHVVVGTDYVVHHFGNAQLAGGLERDQMEYLEKIVSFRRFSFVPVTQVRLPC
jgi:hypothetical protein